MVDCRGPSAACCWHRPDARRGPAAPPLHLYRRRYRPHRPLWWGALGPSQGDQNDGVVIGAGGAPLIGSSPPRPFISRSNASAEYLLAGLIMALGMVGLVTMEVSQ